MLTRPFRFLVVLVLGVSLFSFAVLPAAAQSAQSIAEKMKTRHQEQLQNVDNYVVEADMYTSYHRKVMKNGEPTLETEIRMKNENSLFSSFGNVPTTTSSKPAYYEDLSKNATYAGTEVINGVKCHVLNVKDPSKMDRDAQQMTYYVDAEMYVPRRMEMVQPPEKKGQKSTSVVVNFEDYRTTKGLTLPWRTKMDMQMNMSEEQKQQMKKMMEQMKNLPESQRKMIEKQMPMSFEKMENVMGGELSIEVKEVRVNEGIPEGIFSDSESTQ